MRERHESPRVWKSMQELRAAALAGGCTPAIFDDAVRVMGLSPQRVAVYLERKALFKAPRASPESTPNPR